MNILLILLIPVGYFVFVCIRIIMQEKRAAERKRELARAYNGFVLRERMIIDHSEVVGDMVIALNRSWKELVVIDHHGRNRDMHRIRLTTVTDCFIKEERNGRNYLQEIQMLLFRRTHDQPLIICFRPADRTLAEEQAMLKMARRWKNLVDVHRWVVGSV